jgi:hypothetical protein
VLSNRHWFDLRCNSSIRNSSYRCLTLRSRESPW